MRPAGNARLALLAVLQAGAVGTFDALANYARVPERQAQQTLWDLRREGVVVARRNATAGGIFPQRQRAEYVHYTAVAFGAANDNAFDSLSFARQVWR